MTRKTKLRLAIGVGALLAVSAGTVLALASFRRTGAKELPTTRVRRGNVELNVYTTGELRPPRSMILAGAWYFVSGFVALLLAGTVRPRTRPSIRWGRSCPHAAGL